MRVLYAVHALPAAGLGGTELYTEQLAEMLGGGRFATAARQDADGHEVAVATPRGHETDVEGATVHALPDPGPWTDPTGQASGLESGVIDEDIDRRFADVLDAFDPDVVHLQHLKFLSANLPSLCHERDVPCLLTLHDVWTACHREQLVRPSGALCDGPESVEKCASCYGDALRQSDSAPSRDATDCRQAVERRTEQLTTARRACDLLVSPSRFLREQFVAFGTPREHIVHRRNGIRVERFIDTEFDPAGPLRVGYAGRITSRKGVHVLVDAFEQVDGDAELHVFGQFDPRSDPYHDRLREGTGERVTFHGQYEATTPYERVDVLVVPSLWYENSPLVVQEAFASRVPVVAGDIGGMAELVDHGEDGLTVPPGDVDALADSLQDLVDSPSTVRRLRAGIDPPTSLDEHARELLDLYEAYCRGPEVDAVP